MKTTVKYILTGTCGIVLAACMIMAFTAGADYRKSITCHGAEITILDSTRNGFVSKGDVKGYLDKEYGTYIGEPVGEIDLQKIEDLIDSKSAVLKSQAFVTKDGMLHIDVTQRKPIVRFQKSDGGFYADAEGYIFPLQRSYASHVQVVDGNIPLAADSGFKGAIADPEERAWFYSMMSVINHMESSRLWKDKIVQINVDEDGGLILIPREGNERFLFGKPEDISGKFRKMEKYYTHIRPAKGDGHYAVVDLKYRGQIVCREK